MPDSMRELRTLVPELMDRTDDDESERKDAHEAIFGHYPPEGQPCGHPIHGALESLIEGADLEVPFDAQEIISSDSVYEKKIVQRSNLIYAETRAMQEGFEEEDRRVAEVMAGFGKKYHTS